jgi:hypothetical protein
VIRAEGVDGDEQQVARDRCVPARRRFPSAADREMAQRDGRGKRRDEEDQPEAPGSAGHLRASTEQG